MLYSSRSYWVPLTGDPTKVSTIYSLLPVTMSKDAQLETIVVSIPANHPGGQRCRAGFKFTSVAKPVQVTPEQKEQIVADPYLTVHQSHSRVWYTAQGLPFTEKNLEKYHKKGATPPPPPPEDEGNKGPKSIGTSQSQKGAQESGDGGQGSEGGEGGQGGSEGDEEPSVTSSRDYVIECLEKKGLKANDDFNPEATRNDLLALYKSL